VNNVNKKITDQKRIDIKILIVDILILILFRSVIKNITLLSLLYHFLFLIEAISSIDFWFDHEGGLG